MTKLEKFESDVNSFIENGCKVKTNFGVSYIYINRARLKLMYGIEIDIYSDIDNSVILNLFNNFKHKLPFGDYYISTNNNKIYIYSNKYKTPIVELCSLNKFLDIKSKDNLVFPNSLYLRNDGRLFIEIVTSLSELSVYNHRNYVYVTLCDILTGELILYNEIINNSNNVKYDFVTVDRNGNITGSLGDLSSAFTEYSFIVEAFPRVKMDENKGIKIEKFDINGRRLGITGIGLDKEFSLNYYKYKRIC